MLLEMSDPVLLDRQGPMELHFTEPALEGVQLAHQLDQGGRGGFGDQGGDGARAGGSGGATVPLPFLGVRRVLEGASLKTPGQSDVEFAARHLCVCKCVWVCGRAGPHGQASGGEGSSFSPPGPGHAHNAMRGGDGEGVVGGGGAREGVVGGGGWGQRRVALLAGGVSAALHVAAMHLQHLVRSAPHPGT